VRWEGRATASTTPAINVISSSSSRASMAQRACRSSPGTRRDGPFPHCLPGALSPRPMDLRVDRSRSGGKAGNCPADFRPLAVTREYCSMATAPKRCLIPLKSRTQREKSGGLTRFLNWQLAHALRKRRGNLGEISQSLLACGRESLPHVE
jgi:hypothetical protein